MTACLIPLSADHADGLPAAAAVAALDAGASMSSVQPLAAALPWRLSVVARSRDDARTQLAVVARGEGPAPSYAPVAPRIALLFTGQGAQYPGMAGGLYASLPAFRGHLDRVCAAFAPHLPAPLLPVILGEAGDVHHTASTQPALFAVEVAVAGLLADLGVQPAVVLGHSIGELAAACVAGILDLADAARLVAARGRRMGALPPGGAMVAFRADAETVRAVVAGAPGVDVAAVNAPRQVVISGEVEAVEAAQAALEAQGVGGARLTVSHAFHSLRMDPMLEAFRGDAASVTLRPPTVSLISNRSGRVVPVGDHAPGGPTDPDYWVQQVRGAVRFSEGVAALDQLDVQLAVEVGPHPVLAGLCRQGGLRAPTASVMRRKRDDSLLFAKALAQLWEAGAPLRFAALGAGPVEAAPTR